MMRLSQNPIVRRFMEDETGADTIVQALAGSLACVAVFALIALFTDPISVLAIRGLLLSVSVGCTAGIALCARWMGVLSEDQERIRIPG